MNLVYLQEYEMSVPSLIFEQINAETRKVKKFTVSSRIGGIGCLVF